MAYGWLGRQGQDKKNWRCALGKGVLGTKEETQNIAFKRANVNKAKPVEFLSRNSGYLEYQKDI